MESTNGWRLDDDTFALLPVAWAGEQCGTGSVLEDLADTFARLGRAFEVVFSIDLLCYGHTLFRRYRPLARLSELFNDSWVPAKILFAANKDDGQVGAEMHDLRNPFFLYVVKGVGTVDGEAN